jgi:hypothetical protein
MIHFFSKKDSTTQPLAQLLIDCKVRELNSRYKSKSCDCHPNFQWTVSIDLVKGNYVIGDVIPAEIQPCSFLKEIIAKEVTSVLNPVKA